MKETCKAHSPVTGTQWMFSEVEATTGIFLLLLLLLLTIIISLSAPNWIYNNFWSMICNLRNMRLNKNWWVSFSLRNKLECLPKEKITQILHYGKSLQDPKTENIIMNPHGPSLSFKNYPFVATLASSKFPPTHPPLSDNMYFFFNQTPDISSVNISVSISKRNFKSIC